MKDELLNKKFGLLTVIEQVPRPADRKTQGKYYRCKCDCGNEKIVDKKGLTSGGVQSCGCLRAKRVSEAITIDITGQKFNKLTVLEKINYSETPDKSEAMWLCQCDCGNLTRVRGSALRSGKTKSCGCLQKEVASKISLKDEIGNRYGKLTVIKYLGSNEKQNAIWLCRCDCGNYKETLGVYLRSGHVKSCGCLISTGEQYIQQILQEHGISYISQFTCQSLQSQNNGFYKFDFAIMKNSYTPIGFIEYNGIQHYKDCEFFEPTKDIQSRDRQKEKWCKDRKLPLLVIKYDLSEEEIKKSVIEFVELITHVNDDGTIVVNGEREEEE